MMRIVNWLQWTSSRLMLAVLFAASVLLAGCGPSAEVLEKQEQIEAKAYEEAAKNPPNLPPEIQEKRRYRMKMDFGVTPESTPTRTQGGNN